MANPPTKDRIVYKQCIKKAASRFLPLALGVPAIADDPLLPQLAHSLSVEAVACETAVMIDIMVAKAVNRSVIKHLSEKGNAYMMAFNYFHLITSPALVVGLEGDDIVAVMVDGAKLMPVQTAVLNDIFPGCRGFTEIPAERRATFVKDVFPDLDKLVKEPAIVEFLNEFRQEKTALAARDWS